MCAESQKQQQQHGGLFVSRRQLMLAMQTHNKVLKVKYGASVVNCRNELIAVIPLKACRQAECGKVITVCCVEVISVMLAIIFPKQSLVSL